MAGGNLTEEERTALEAAKAEADSKETTAQGNSYAQETVQDNSGLSEGENQTGEEKTARPSLKP